MPVRNEILEYLAVTSGKELDVSKFGIAAKTAQSIKILGISSPDAIALSFDAVRLLSGETLQDLDEILDKIVSYRLVSVFSSVANLAWGGPGEFRDVGLNDEIHAIMIKHVGKAASDKRYLNYIHAYSFDVKRLDPDVFEEVRTTNDPIKASLDIFEIETGEPWPQAMGDQLAAVLTHMARAWDNVSARLLRQAVGAPTDAGLSLLLMDYSWSVKNEFKGLGEVRNFDVVIGESRLSGKFQTISDIEDENARSIPIVGADDERSFSKDYPDGYRELLDILHQCRGAFKDELTFEFAVFQNTVLILNAIRPVFETRATINLSVSLADDGIITRNEALLRVDPKSLTELLHAKVDPGHVADIAFSGVPASPGGAAGMLVFSAGAALRLATKNTPCILVRRETSPEDVRGLLATKGVVTERGGATSHAAVIARGLGVPCIAGVTSIKISSDEKTLTLPDGTVLHEGDIITIDGSSGTAYVGQMPMREPSMDASFERLMSWADDVRELGVRANADTPEDALMAQKFGADGIGLCRTEHMFFEPSRMTLMRELIFAENETGRLNTLERLLPMQQSDFTDLFKTMAGKPVCIRLFDPPLHEFLPADREGQIALAEALNLSVSHVVKRIEALAEYNPMLGLRGVRLGITVPEIYDMQVRAVFLAAIDASLSIGQTIVPEIMIPLVSTKREVDIIKKRMDQVAAELCASGGQPADYKLGVLLETPRAVLRATDIAEHAQIMSFGTNDLTQMTFGISRDDIGRFIGQYLEAGAFEADPFSQLDIKGVGELMAIGAKRARAGRKDVVLTLCGEHAGDVDVIRFCESLGFRYVSCSPFRVPIARLAAAQLAI